MIRWAAVIVVSLSWLFAFRHYVGEDPYRHSSLVKDVLKVKPDPAADAKNIASEGAQGAAPSFFRRSRVAFTAAAREFVLKDPMRLGQWGVIAVAWVLGVFGFVRYAGRMHLPLPYLLLLLPAAIVLFILIRHAAPAYRPPIVLFAIGTTVLAVTSGVGFLAWMRPMGLSALVLGTILILQSPLYWMVCAFTARSTSVPFLAPIVHALLSWIGSDVSWNDGAVFVRMMRDVHMFPLTWDHLALLPLLSIWAAGGLFLWWDRARRPFFVRLTAFSLVLLGYAVFRVFLVILIFITAMVYVEHEEDILHVEVFWLPWITAITWLPLIPLVARLVRWPRHGGAAAFESREWDHPGRRSAALVAACVGCLGLVVGLYFFDPGSQKAGRVLLDESHSRWERTDNPYNTDWYGHESGYNYYCIAEYLKHFYAFEVNMTGALTPQKLSAFDVLILKTPTESYSREELEAIEAFVRGGGGLFALGEHTNVFGSSSFLNPVIEPFGIAFRGDVILDIERKWEQVYFSPKLGVHPAISRMPFDRFAVSCSIASDWRRTRPVIRSTGLWSLPSDYAAANFYPKVEDKTYARFGAFDQMVTAEPGRGRVAAFGDSTVYSNFAAFYPGKAEKLVGTVAWLNRSNRWNWINTAGYLVFVISALFFLFVCAWLPPHLGFSATLASCAAVTVWLGIWGATVYARRAYPAPAPHTPVKTVIFDMEHSRYELPIFGFTQKYADSFEIFYQWVLRLGYYTDVAFDFDRALRSTDPIVVIRPKKAFPPETIAAARESLERGGSILVLDSPGNATSTANEFLGPFQLGFSAGGARGASILEPQTGSRVCGLRGGRAVTGGTVLLSTDANSPIAAYSQVGKGHLIVAGLADRFVDVQMGGSNRAVPDQEMRAVFELEFALLRGLVEGNLPEQMRLLGQTYAVPKP